MEAAEAAAARPMAPLGVVTLGRLEPALHTEVESTTPMEALPEPPRATRAQQFPRRQPRLAATHARGEVVDVMQATRYGPPVNVLARPSRWSRRRQSTNPASHSRRLVMGTYHGSALQTSSAQTHKISTIRITSTTHRSGQPTQSKNPIYLNKCDVCDCLQQFGQLEKLTYSDLPEA
jgi:hypothetical protein